MPQSATQSEPGSPAPSALVKPESRSPAWLAALLLGLATVALYWPAMSNGFVNFDDDVYITSNIHVQAGLTLAGLKWAVLRPNVRFGYWHPLTLLSHMLDCQLYGLNPWGHHLTSVLLHALNTMLVFLLLQRLTGATWRSALVAAVFGWHPAHVESVAWVSERKDVLCTCFGLLTLLCYVRYVEQLKNKTAIPINRERECKTFYLLALIFFACSLLSKPMLVTWPFVLLLLDFWPLGRWPKLNIESASVPQCGTTADRGQKAELNIEHRTSNSEHRKVREGGAETARLSTINHKQSTLCRLVLEKVPFFALVAAESVVTFVLSKEGGVLETVQNLPLSARFSSALVSYCRYLGKLFWPAKLAVYYPRLTHWPPAEVLLAGGFLLGVTALFFAARRRYPFLLMGWLWFIGMLVPVIGLVQVGEFAIADRYTYVSSLGVLIAAVWGLCELTGRWRFRRPALSLVSAAVIVICLVLTRQQLGYWRDSETLFRHTLAVTENNYLARNNLATALYIQGRMDEAAGQFQASLRVKPDFSYAHNGLGKTLAAQGRTDEAISQYEDAVRVKPDYAEARNNLGAAFYQKGRMNDAIGQFLAAIQLNPDYAEPHYNLGLICYTQGDIDEAINQFRTAIRLKPDYSDAYNDLGNTLFKRGRLDEAISQFEQVVLLKPDDAGAYNNLGIALAKAGRMEEAINEYQQAVRLKPDFADARNNLGKALGRTGRIGEAISQFQEAIRLKPDEADLHNNLGIALAGQGQIDAAIGQFQEAIRLQPDFAAARDNLARALSIKNAPAGNR